MITIPIAFTYATYGGLTITGVTVFGLIKFNQTPNFFSLTGIVLIVLGIFLINCYGK
jgi:small multidrug resistance pump|tara:strand:+ start:685 stop:855 length:171 start_codon:yes stop_codon:yes gene_type:complete